MVNWPWSTLGRSSESSIGIKAHDATNIINTTLKASAL